MTAQRRDPGHFPNFAGMTWIQAKVPLSDFLKRLWAGFEGIPGGFLGTLPSAIRAGVAAFAGTAKAGWAAADHAHPVTTSAPSGLSNINADGVGPALMRADAQIKRDVRVKADNFEIGTRNALNFRGSDPISVEGLDDPAGDKVNVTVSESLLRYYIFS